MEIKNFFKINTKVNQDIECLRAVAILMVLVQHIKNMFNPPLAWFKLYDHFAFWTGVDLFFVISGYVISSTLLKSGDEIGNFKLSSIKSFYIKRIFRILPNAFLWLAIPLIVYPTFIKSVENINFKLMTNAVIASIFNCANLFWAYCVTNHLIGIDAPNPDSVGIFWSLSLEEQFYIIFPLLLLFVSKKYFFILFSFIILLQTQFLRPSFSYGWVFRTDAITMGVMISFFLNKIKLPNIILNNIEKSKLIINLLALFIIIGIMFLTSYFTRVPSDYGLTIIAFLCSILVFIASFDANLLFPSFITPILSFIGSRSYSLYLCHLFTFAIVREIYVKLFGIIPNQSWTTFMILAFIGIISAVTIANTSYVYFEVPLRNYGRKLADKFIN